MNDNCENLSDHLLVFRGKYEWAGRPGVGDCSLRVLQVTELHLDLYFNNLICHFGVFIVFQQSDMPILCVHCVEQQRIMANGGDKTSFGSVSKDV